MSKNKNHPDQNLRDFLESHDTETRYDAPAKEWNQIQARVVLEEQSIWARLFSFKRLALSASLAGVVLALGVTLMLSQGQQQGTVSESDLNAFLEENYGAQLQEETESAGAEYLSLLESQ